MGSELVFHEKVIEEAGSIVEIKIWKIPTSFDKPHGYKYSFVYVRNGKRVVGYDNAERKGDHKHYDNIETPYKFTDINKLFNDFYKDIRRWKNEG